jgi:hypothetical protein
MKHTHKLQRQTWLKGILLTIGLVAITNSATTFAHGGGHWHHHDHGGWGHHGGHFGTGLLVGGVVGLLAGAAAMSGNNTEAYPQDDAYPYYGSCRRVFVRCHIRDGYYGPERVCYRTVRWVC